MKDTHQAQGSSSPDQTRTQTSPAPGKSPRTGTVQHSRGGAVQGKGQLDSGAVQDAAARGVSGGGGALPHADAIQRSFGGHDVSDVQAHTGDQAATACNDMSAMAYAMGTHVAFKQAPDLHTAAHESAHVVQQRAGVELSGGVGQEGDRYENHADAVADAVVAGQSAEGLLDQMTGQGAGGGSHVQRSPDPGGGTSSVDPGTGGGTGAGTDAEAGECRELSIWEILVLLGQIAAGTEVSENERTNLVDNIESLSNTQFAALIKLGDTMGVLQTVLQGLYGNTADPSGPDDQFEIPVLCYRFWNAADQIQADVDTANTIYNHHGIYVNKTSERTISKDETEAVVGSPVTDDFLLDRSYSGGAGNNEFTHADMKKVVQTFVPTTAIAGLWAKRVVNQTGADLAGTSSPAFVFGDSYHKLAAVATDYSGADTFAHELGHVLANEGHSVGLMETGSSRDKTQTGSDLLSDEQVTAIKANVLGYVRAAAP